MDLLRSDALPSVAEASLSTNLLAVIHSSGAAPDAKIRAVEAHIELLRREHELASARVDAAEATARLLRDSLEAKPEEDSPPAAPRQSVGQAGPSAGKPV